MYYIVSILTGVIIAATIAMNGELSNTYGLYSATALIHLCGLVLAAVLMIIKSIMRMNYRV